MASIKISTKVEESAWADLKSLAKESHQSISGLLTEAVQDYVRRRRVRPDVLAHLEDSIEQNEELGRRLAEGQDGRETGIIGLPADFTSR